jgi:apolipoprotein D and lipocalin family protein
MQRDAQPGMNRPDNWRVYRLSNGRNIASKEWCKLPKTWFESLARIGVCAGFALLAGCVSPPPVNRASGLPLAVAANVDLDRYSGLWHEAARLENSFEKGCVAVTATYTPSPNGQIGVRNWCRMADGREKIASGRARIVDPATNAKLEVSFFGPFWGDYWVLERSDDYSWALVGEPEGRYLWVLTRAPKIDPGLRADLTARLAAIGYRTEDLTWAQ